MSIYQGQAYNFGQLGSAYLGDDSIFYPPTGMVVVSILSLADTVGFTKLKPVQSDNSAYFGTAYTDISPVPLNGTAADPLPTDETFPAGIALFGRWSEVQINGTNAAVILYFGY